MLCLILLLAAPEPDNARRVIEWQLRSPPRAEESTGLSAEEAQAVRSRYLQSIGQRLPRSADQDTITIP